MKMRVARPRAHPWVAFYSQFATRQMKIDPQITQILAFIRVNPCLSVSNFPTGNAQPTQIGDHALVFGGIQLPDDA